MRRLCILLALCLCLPFFSFAEEGEVLDELLTEPPVQRVNRALLVGCDRFLTQQDTTPSSANNVLQLEDALSQGTMAFATLTTCPDGLGSMGELAGAILDAFADADADDVSLFYLSTHGVWTEDTSGMRLLLSDGQRESSISPWQLRTVFDQIEGTKVLMIDACHAGAMVGKGVNEAMENVFRGEDYIVICSSGGAEKSWFWSGDIDGERLAGAGYFSGMLMRAISPRGSYGADDNRDGEITLTELKRYLLEHHGASTVRTYPENSDFPIFTYDVEGFSGQSRAALIDSVCFESDVLTADDPTVYFSFNVVKSVQVAYQFVYHRDGQWDFDGATLIYDNNGDFSPRDEAGKALTLGLKERAITIDRADAGSSGYILLQVLSIEKGMPAVVSSRVLCVPPESGDPLLNVTAPDFFAPEEGEELTFNVLHAFPCELAVTIEDMTGRTVRRISARSATRPEQLDPSGSAFTWDGLSSDGELAPEGLYRIHVKAYVGDERYEFISDPIILLGVSG